MVKTDYLWRHNKVVIFAVIQRKGRFIVPLAVLVKHFILIIILIFLIIIIITITTTTTTTTTKATTKATTTKMFNHCRWKYRQSHAACLNLVFN